MAAANRHVFLLTAGSYSDYRVLRVFTSYALATAWCDTYNSLKPYEQARIETHDVVSELPLVREATSLTTHYGTDTSRKPRTHEATEVRLLTPYEATRSVTDEGYSYTTTTGIDRDRTRKSHYDRVAKRRAEELGL